MGGERINLLHTKFRPSVHHFCSIDERCSEKKKHHFSTNSSISTSLERDNIAFTFKKNFYNDHERIFEP